MKTKVTILGQAEAVKPELKKIEFVKIILTNGVAKALSKPCEWDNIMLIKSKYDLTETFDLIYAWGMDGDDSYRACYLGHFNDGIV